MCRPGGYGGSLCATYSIHKLMHSFIPQILINPDGLIISLFGLDVGCRHDFKLFLKSVAEPNPQKDLHIDVDQYYRDGQKVYILRPWMNIG